MSPHDVAQHEQAIQASQYQAQLAHHPSISENDFEQTLGAYPQSASVPPQNFSSPPHTPMFYDHPTFSQRVGSGIILENTPPQSAPAGQSCFPSNIFTSVPQPVQQQPQPAPVPVQQPMQAPIIAQPQPQVVEQQYQVPPVTFAPNQHSNVTTGPPPGVPLQFANGIPTVTAGGTVKMSFPPQAQLMQQQSQRMNTPPQSQYAFVSGSPNMQGAAHTFHQSPSELQVHQYNPPDAMKRSSTPRKPVESGPKNYTFANHGPLDYEKKEAKRAEARDSANSCSPVSSNGTASTIWSALDRSNQFPTVYTTLIHGDGAHNELEETTRRIMHYTFGYHNLFLPWDLRRQVFVFAGNGSYFDWKKAFELVR
jgi:hypothetical protein